jgi:Pvc16 N-terminal domain
MDDCAFILNVDKALANLIWNGVKDDPKTQALISSEKQISFASPKTGETGSKKLAVFLYSIVEDAANRNRAPAVDSSGKRIAQASFALRYLVTPCTGNEESDHLLLGKIIQILANTPVLAGNTAGNGSEFTVKLDSLSLLDQNSLWTALGTPFKPCASYTVSPVSINCVLGAQEKTERAFEVPQAATNTNRTFELYQIVMKTFLQQSDDWKKNFFKKQFVNQDFKKITEMSVDEMLTALNSLGDKLELHLATKQFIKPLNALADYYEHLIEALKGSEKFSKKRQGTLEMIAGWTRDVKALVDALSA